MSVPSSPQGLIGHRPVRIVGPVFLAALALSVPTITGQAAEKELRTANAKVEALEADLRGAEKDVTGATEAFRRADEETQRQKKKLVDLRAQFLKAPPNEKAAIGKQLNQTIYLVRK